MTLLYALITVAQAQQTWPADAVIEDAAAVQITDDGLDAITALIPALLPSEIPVDTVADEGGWWCVNYGYELSNIWVGIEVSGADITPGNGVLDVTADSAALGKTAGKDARAEKSTYVSTLGLEGARAEADALLNKALDALTGFGNDAEALRQLARQMVHRQS